ncbi:MAG: hypothetical protein WCB19_08075 [Thermoplasmata archaeon]
MDPDQEIDGRVLALLRGLSGVLVVELLPAELRSELRSLATPAAAENRGVEAVLSRQRVVCLFKGGSFRGPPESALLMMDERGAILGRELTGPQDRPAPGERRTVYLGRDFVLIHGLRPSGRVRFVLPPVRFPELEGVASVSQVVSGSPDPPQDERLRNHYGVTGGKDLASILVGYDVGDTTPAEAADP